ncbi:MAG: class I mannose-6-phosphate isomerase [Clostridia bacterium]|nr:class I mannose-6-phosphate isomerase [Clostridia bacterium]
MPEKIIFCQPIFKTAIWGGNNLSKIFNVNPPFEKVSEIWTASAHKNGETPITIGGDTKALSLSQYYQDEKEIFGLNCRKYKDFPLLIKWLDANDKLSVQVHPGDDYAKKHYDSLGKTEAWYIVSAKPGAQIVYGLKPGTTKKALITAITENRIEDVLNFVPVKAGDVFFIPAGMVHALLDGVVVYEIQQSSDITYRLYDWNRVGADGNPRELHIQEALDVIDFDNNINVSAYNNNVLNEDKLLRLILESKYFDLRIRNVNQNAISSTATTKASFKLCSVLTGSITIGNEDYSHQVNAGESFIIPAAEGYIGGCSFCGNATIMEATVK